MQHDNRVGVHQRTADCLGVLVGGRQGEDGGDLRHSFFEDGTGELSWGGQAVVSDPAAMPVALWWSVVGVVGASRVRDGGGGGFAYCFGDGWRIRRFISSLID